MTTEAADAPVPTLRARMLGNLLRELREEAGLGTRAVADALQCGIPKISRMETGQRGVRPLDMTILLELYHVTEPDQVRRYKQLAKDATRQGWWSEEGPLLNPDLNDYLTLEEDSTLVRAYEPWVMPGLLQTEEYMRRVFEFGVRKSQVDQQVDVRMKRKNILAEKEGFQLHVVIDVVALHRIAPELRHHQIREIKTHAQSNNVTVQILPLDATLRTDQYPPYTLFGLSNPPMTVVWLEHRTGSTMLEKSIDLASYEEAWTEMTAAALSPEKSLLYLSDLAERTKES